MGIKDIFKKKKKKGKSSEVKEEPRKKVEEVKARPETKEKTRKEKIFNQTYKILKAPHITEKATDLARKNQYIFEVFLNANKVEIKKAIESLYGVDVLSVKIIKIPKKKRRFGRILGWRSGYKKAIVRIKEGQKIEVIPR